MGVVLRAACPGLHPCPLTVDRSVLELCSSRFEVSGVPPSPRGSCRFRVSSDRRSERLEPYEGKLSRTVLRGLGGSNPARPLDRGWVWLGAQPARSETPVRALSGVHPEGGAVEVRRERTNRLNKDELAASHLRGSWKQAGLCFGVYGLVEIAQADTHQAKTLFGTKIEFVSQVKSDSRQLVTSGWRNGGSMAAGEDFEIAGLELENYRPCDASFLARSGPDLFRKPPDHRLGFGDGKVVLEGVLGGDGFGWPVRSNFARVDTAGKLIEPDTKTAELLFERG